jgi:Tfp pilus assembly protein FimT
LRSGSIRPRGREAACAGFTLIELTIVILIGMVLIALATLAFGTANTRMAARRSAQVFSRDLALARSMAVRGREKVTIKFYENARWYEVKTASGRSLATRRFGVNEDVNLSTIKLDLPGDSLVFSNRGVGTISSSLGTATFTAGAITYQVSFNAIGASRVAGL